MPRLAESELLRLAELKTHLSTFEEGAPPVLADLVVELKSLLGADRGVAYGLDAAEGKFSVSFIHATARTEESRRVLDRDYGVAGGGGGYNPARPQPAQRNRPITTAQLERLSPGAAQSRISTRGLPEVGLGGMDQLRVLVCEGDALLGWVGGFRHEPFGWRERMLLGELTPALRRRLWLERQLDASHFALAALDQALALLPSAAYVVQGRGRIVHANPTGKLRLGQDGRGVRERIEASLRGLDRTGVLRVIPLAARGAPGYALVIEREAMPMSSADPDALSQKWGLSPRQAEVFQWLLRGYANKSIAAELQCSARTVEQHVTALLAKAGVNSRAELIVQSTRLR